MLKRVNSNMMIGYPYHGVSQYQNNNLLDNIQLNWSCRCSFYLNWNISETDSPVVPVMLRTADIDYSAAVDIIRYTKNRRER